MRYEIHHAAVLPPRAATFVAIAGLHVFFVYLFMSGLAQSAFQTVAEPLKLVDVAELPRIAPQPPTVPPPTFERVPVDDFPIPPVPLPTENAITAQFTPDPMPITDPIPAVRPPERLLQIGSNRIPNAEEYYPASLKRQGIEGATVVRACVDEKGRLQGDPMVQRSSGYEGFDKGAVQAARDGRYARATRGGQPVPNCYAFKITFTVNLAAVRLRRVHGAILLCAFHIVEHRTRRFLQRRPQKRD